MSATIDLTNLDRHYEYTLLLDGEQSRTPAAVEEPQH